MRYQVKKYGDLRFLMIQDPYTKENLRALDLSAFEEDDMLIVSNILTFFEYYDFVKTLSYQVFILLDKQIEGADSDKVDAETLEYYILSLATILEIPRSQATQLIYIGLDRGEIMIKETNSFKEAYSISHNLDVSYIDNKVLIK